MSKVLIIPDDIVAPRMGGCGIRPFEMAKFLSNFHEVTLSISNRSITNLSNSKFKISILNEKNLKEAVDNNDVIIIQGRILKKFPFIKTSLKPMVIELYTPFILEDLVGSFNREEGIYRYLANIQVYIDQLLRGDYFICANERQKDFILGMFCILNRLNPINYEEDKTFHKLINVIPFGIPSDEPAHNRKVLKGVYKNIKDNDRVILWLGGIWDWLDPVTPIKAMEEISKKREDIKLIFSGTKHPAHQITQMCKKAIEFTKELDLYDKYVFFEEALLYNERSDYLMESDIGIITHPNHIETRFSHRTRVADYIWANLPIIATKGGALSDFIEEKKLGITVDYTDVESLVNAILQLLEDSKFYAQCKENLRNISGQFRWDRVLEPLNEFCKNPKVAPDKEYLKQWYFKFKAKDLKKRSLKYYFNRLTYFYNREGIVYTVKYCLRKIFAHGCKTV